MKPIVRAAAFGVLLSISACTGSSNASNKTDSGDQSQSAKPEILVFSIR